MNKLIEITKEEIEDIIIESIKKIINESRGINDELEMAASAMSVYIQKNILKSPIKYDNQKKQNYHILNYRHDFEDKSFNWSIIGYIHPNDSEFENNISIRFSKGASSSDGKTLFLGWIIFPMTESGWFSYGEVADTIYHEMLHLLKAKKAGKNVGNQDFIGIGNYQYQASNGIEKDIAVVCYMSSGDEQDAYVNGFYGLLKEEFLQHHNINIREIFYKSEVYRKIIEIKTALKNLSDYNPEQLAPYIKKYNTSTTSLSYKKLINLGKNTLVRLSQKIALMLRHYEKLLYYYGFRSNPPIDILDF